MKNMAFIKVCTVILDIHDLTISPESFPQKSGTNFCSKITQLRRNRRSIQLKTNSVNNVGDTFPESNTRFWPYWTLEKVLWGIENANGH